MQVPSQVWLSNLILTLALARTIECMRGGQISGGSEFAAGVLIVRAGPARLASGARAED